MRNNKKTKFDYLNREKFMAFAHRGANLLAPENSLESFKIASKLGFTNFEIDIQASKDGVPFVCHDNNLKRLTGMNVCLSNLSSADVKKIRLKDGHEIPKLIDLIEEFPNSCFNIDAKSWGVVDPLCNVLNSFTNTSNFCIAAFCDSRIRSILKKLKAPICFSLGPRLVALFYFTMFTRIGLRFSAGCLQIPLTYKGFNIISKSVVEYAHSLNLKVHVWTINDEIIMNKLIDYGVDGIMTDDCRLLRKVLVKRNLWKC